MSHDPMTHFYDRIARYYDAENSSFSDDLPLYESLAQEYGGPILDVGCGTGRVGFHLAQLGYSTVGVDTSAEMLAIARQKMKGLPVVADNLTLHHEDILQHQGGPYPLILLPYNALMHFHSQTEQLKLLKHLSGLLTKDGLIALDMPNAGEAFASEGDNTLSLERSFIEPVSGHLVMQQSVSQIDRSQQLLLITWIYDEIQADGLLKRTLAPLTLRYVFAAELDLLLRICGLKRREIYGDYDESDFIDGCPRMIVLIGKNK